MFKPKKTLEAESPETLNSIRTGLFVRTLALARIALATKSELLSPEFLTRAEADPELMKQVEEQAKEISRELGQLKGSAMKVGQLLSLFGEHFLPAHVNSVLKLLQADSPPVDWRGIEPQMKKELGARYDELEIEPVAFAAASIGQVHRAKIKATGERIVLKVQYPDVERAIQSDLRAVKTLLLFAPGAMKGDRANALMAEIEEMLARELDYQTEAANYEKMRRALENDQRFWVPRVLAEYSTSRVLALEFAIGERIDSETVAKLSQDRRNLLGQALLELYLRELFYFGQIQSDSHIGNFLISTGPSSESSPDRIVLLDFGAVRSFDREFLRNYAALVDATLRADRNRVTEEGTALGFLKACDSSDVHEAFFEFCRLVVEPFSSENQPYCWKNSDLARRLAQQLNKVIQAREFRPPPRESLFLDRKSTGLFCLLTMLEAKTDGRMAVEKAIKYRLSQISEHSKDE